MLQQTQEQPPQPPSPPETPARVRLAWLQAVGMSLLALISLLALFSVFGESAARTSASGRDLELDVQYPARFRYKMTDAVQVRVRNRSERPLDRVVVTFDERYISQFSNVTFTPQVQRPYQVELSSVQPGETRLVSVELQAEKYWRHAGTITATAGGGDSDGGVTATLSTTVFP